MAAYYNEIDRYAAQWLRNLIEAGFIAPGDVDERSIVDVRAGDLAGYDQCHFFAGLGGWSHALRLAGWPDDRPVWTGSCPCQPFSAAGRRAGFRDARDLWPAWFGLISESRPAIIFGEQVDEQPLWIDRCCLDLESRDYAVAAAVLPACAVGAPHRRDRFWFVADGERERLPSRVFERSTSATVEPESVRRGRYGYPIGATWDCEPELAVLVHGLPSDVDATEALGNAIVPQLAAAFIRAAIG